MIKDLNGIDLLNKMKQQLQTAAGPDPEALIEIDRQIVEMEDESKKDISEINNQQ
jgi:hypothetical protein